MSRTAKLVIMLLGALALAGCGGDIERTTVEGFAVTSPNGGESWTVGTNATVTWRTYGTFPSVDLYLSTDGGATWPTALATGAANTGTATITVPSSLSTQCRVRVSDPSGTPSDGSDANFSIVTPPPPTVTVVSPNGGETWTAGSTATVTWSSTGALTSVAIELSTDSGATFPTTLVASTANTGSALVTVPSLPGTTCRVRVRDLGGTPSDDSNADFTIVLPPAPTITCLGPNGGESWTAGGNATVTWSTTGTLANVRIDLSTDGGATWPMTLLASTPNDGSAGVTVPSTSGAQCRVRVSDTSLTPTDASDADFTILPALTVTAPNGGEYWVDGSTASVTWDSFGAVGDVSILLSTDSGASWPTTLVTSMANTGSAAFTVPSFASAACRVRVSDLGGTPSDDSDADFTIGTTPPPTVTLLSPNGGETWTSGSSVTVTWSSLGAVGDVRLELSNDGGATWPITLFASTANDGTETFLAPSNVSGTACRVRLSDTTSTSTDTSAADFTILPTFAVTSPNGGETWEVGGPATVTWTSNGSEANVRIDLSLDGGATYVTNLVASTANDGTATITVPDLIGAACRVRVADLSVTVSDESDGNFEVVPAPPPTVALLTPNGGETWVSGDPVTVTWSSAGPVGPVMLELTIDAGGSWTTLFASTANDGTETFTAPTNASGPMCRIRVSDTTGSSSDTSDSYFTLLPKFTVTAPNGGEVFVIGNPFTVTWTSTGAEANVRIDLSVDDGASYAVTLAASTANDGTETFTAPGPMSATCRVRVSDVLVTASDTSDAVFTLQ